MTLNGIDISSWQSDLKVAKMTTTDFVIVKATEDTDYINPSFASHAAATIKAGKKLGIYHFASIGDAVEQADYFLGAVKKYYGKAILCLDWEAEAVSQGPAWALRFMNRIAKKTGQKCLIYMSKSVCNAYDWSKVVKAGHGLWVAQYPDYSETGYKSKPWTDSLAFGAWKDHYDIFQYTSCGIIPGYSGHLDLDLFIGSKVGWDAWCKGSVVKSTVTKITTPTSKVTNTIPKWEKMVDKAIEIAKDDSHGYSQYRRWPSQGTDFDCSSLMYYCADYAGYGVKMTDPRYTGSMVADFTAVGFKKIQFSKSALQPGDILLSHNDSVQHTELYIGDGKTVGAHIAETGGIDGKPGDQTGNEISVQNLSWTPQWILRPPDSGSSSSSSSSSSEIKEADGPKYCVYTGGKWLDPMIGTEDTGGSSDDYAGIMGSKITYIAIANVGKYRVKTKKSGWLPWVKKYDLSDFENGCAGDGSAIIALQIPSSKVMYRLHDLNGGWNDYMIGKKDTGGSSDTYAGSNVPVDALQILWA